MNFAAEKKGYALTDRTTLLVLKKKPGLDILVERYGKRLNIHRAIKSISPDWTKINTAGRTAFADFIVSKKTPVAIGRFGIDKFGAPLFFPDAGYKPESLGF